MKNFKFVVAVLLLLVMTACNSQPVPPTPSRPSAVDFVPAKDGFLEMYEYDVVVEEDDQGTPTSILFMGSIGDEALAALVRDPRFTKLKRLDLSHPENFTDDGLVSVGQLSELESLDLTACTSITDAGLSNLNGCDRLAELTIARLTDEGMQHLSELSALRVLRCDYSP